MMEGSKGHEQAGGVPYVLPAHEVISSQGQRGEITCPDISPHDEVVGALSVSGAVENPSDAHDESTRRVVLPSIEELPEWGLLSGEAVHATPEAGSHEAPDVMAEAKRTRLSDHCLREAYTGQQQKLSGMSPEDFTELHTFTRSVVGDDATFEAVRYLMDVHDVGKSGVVRES
jgi:hypothetical protein